MLGYHQGVAHTMAGNMCPVGPLKLAHGPVHHEYINGKKILWKTVKENCDRNRKMTFLVHGKPEIICGPP